MLIRSIKSATAITVNKDLPQTVISILYKFTNVPHKGLEQTADFTTSSDFKDILKFNISIDKVETIKVNVGTVLEPKIEEKKTKQSVQKAECSFI